MSTKNIKFKKNRNNTHSRRQQVKFAFTHKPPSLDRLLRDVATMGMRGFQVIKLEHGEQCVSPRNSLFTLELGVNEIRAQRDAIDTFRSRYLKLPFEPLTARDETISTLTKLQQHQFESRQSNPLDVPVQSSEVVDGPINPKKAPAKKVTPEQKQKSKIKKIKPNPSNHTSYNNETTVQPQPSFEMAQIFASAQFQQANSFLNNTVFVTPARVQQLHDQLLRQFRSNPSHQLFASLASLKAQEDQRAQSESFFEALQCIINKQ